MTDHPNREALGDSDILRAVRAIQAGLKPVAKIEAHEDELETLTSIVLARSPELSWRHRRPGRADALGVEIFIGSRLEEVEQAIDLTEQSETERDPRAIEELITRLGVLFGYPPCCATAFAQEQPFFRDRNEWLIVKRRLDAQETVGPDAHPMITGYVPCSLECEASLQLVAELTCLDDPARRRRWPSHPTVLLVDKPGNFAALDPRSDVTVSGFEFAVEVRRGDDPRLESFERANALAISPGHMTLMRNELVIAELDGSVFPWWCGGVFHREYWQTRLEELEASADQSSPRMNVQARLRWVLEQLERHSRDPLRGFQLLDLDDDETGGIIVDLRRGDEQLRLVMLPEDQCSGASVAVDGLAVDPVRSRSIEDGDRRTVALVVLKALSRAFNRR